jgi:bacteriorhodopsin
MLRVLQRLFRVGKGGGALKPGSGPMTIALLYRYAFLAIATAFIAIMFIRLSQCLPQYKNKRKKKLSTFNLKTMVIFGSGKNMVR